MTSSNGTKSYISGSWELPCSGGWTALGNMPAFTHADVGWYFNFVRPGADRSGVPGRNSESDMKPLTSFRKQT